MTVMESFRSSSKARFFQPAFPSCIMVTVLFRLPDLSQPDRISLDKTRKSSKFVLASRFSISRLWVRVGPEFGHDPADGYADDAAEQYFSDAACAELHSGELGMLFQT